MSNKFKKINIDELNLWKEVTKNDIKINSYLQEDQILAKPRFNKKNDIENKKDQTFLKKDSIISNRQRTNCIPQANKSILLKLKRGRIPIENILDLHGYNKKNAKIAVKNFIKESISKSYRCILIITGKKSNSLGSGSVLRKALPDWLKEDDILYLLLSHCYATVKDGGDGARYVLLRKKDKV